MTQWNETSAQADELAVAEQIQAASTDEVFAFIDNELGRLRDL